MTDPELLAEIRSALAREPGPLTATRVAGLLRSRAGVCAGADLLAALRALDAELSGAGPLAPLLEDPEVTDVAVNGAADVWIDRGDGWVPHPARFADDQAVAALAVRLVTAAGRRLDTAHPCADVVLPDGHRLHAVVPPVTRHAVLSVRAVRPRPFTLADLAAHGSFPGPLAGLLTAVVTARLTALITGGTGSGKTTVLGAILSSLPAAERVVVIEDPPELRAGGGQIVTLAGRPPNAEGAGGISQRDLVREALRMRPDRLVIGEVRGAEMLDLLIALNTGHEGGLATLHANGAAQVPARVEALAALAGLRRGAVHSLLAAGVQVVVHLARSADGRRRVRELGVVRAGRDGLARVVPALVVQGAEVQSGPGKVALHALLAERGAVAAAGPR